MYGGGHVGLMGAIADTVMAAGGEVDGVIPKPLTERELALETVTRLHVVSSMHERKALMASLSDAFIALPGGFGTLEELFEVVAWAQLGIHRKPIGPPERGRLLRCPDRLRGPRRCARLHQVQIPRAVRHRRPPPGPPRGAAPHHQPPATRRWLSEDET